MQRILLFIVRIPTVLLSTVLITVIGLLETVLAFLTVSSESETNQMEVKMIEVKLKDGEVLILQELMVNSELDMVGGEDRLGNFIFISPLEVKYITIHNKSGEVH